MTRKTGFSFRGKQIVGWFIYAAKMGLHVVIETRCGRLIAGKAEMLHGEIVLSHRGRRAVIRNLAWLLVLHLPEL